MNPMQALIKLNPESMFQIFLGIWDHGFGPHELCWCGPTTGASNNERGFGRYAVIAEYENGSVMTYLFKGLRRNLMSTSLTAVLAVCVCIYDLTPRSCGLGYLLELLGGSGDLVSRYFMD